MNDKIILIVMSVLSTLFLSVLFYAVFVDKMLLMLTCFVLSIVSVSSLIFNVMNDE